LNGGWTLTLLERRRIFVVSEIVSLSVKGANFPPKRNEDRIVGILPELPIGSSFLNAK
jgi:hypothetical protein